MPTLIANLWTPDVWLAAMREAQATYPSIYTSKAAVRTAEMDAVASGEGVLAKIPFWADITDQADEPQVENTAPTDNNITSGQMFATILNRVTKNSASALSAAVSGGDPIREMTTQMIRRRMKQRNTTLINILNGLIHNASTPAAATGALKNNRNDIFIEAGNSAVAANLISVDAFINTKTLLGERSETLMNGALFMHSNICAALEKQDNISFSKNSLGPYQVRTYRGIPIFISDALVRAGATNGSVYTTYLLGEGVIGWGEKDQKGDVIDVASLQYYADKDKNNEAIYDRTRWLAHVLGTKFTGTPAGQSATNAELATYSNWSLVFQTAARIPLAALRSNG